MALANDMAPHIKDALLEVPLAYRAEVSDALCAHWAFEEWRLTQDPVVDDTSANRADYISWMMAHTMISRIKGVVQDARSRSANSSINEELGV